MPYQLLKLVRTDTLIMLYGKLVYKIGDLLNGCRLLSRLATDTHSIVHNYDS